MAYRFPILLLILGMTAGLGFGLVYSLALREDVDASPIVSAAQSDWNIQSSSTVVVIQQPEDVTPVPVSQAEPLASSSTIRLLFVGDVMLDRHVADRMKIAKSLAYPFARLREDVRFSTDRDALIANLEGPVTSQRRPPIKSIDFAFDPRVAPMLRDVGITAVSQANNHTLDQGRAGADESRQMLLQTGLAVFGDQTREDATSAMTVLPIRGTRVALIGFDVTTQPLDRAEARKTIETATTVSDVQIVFMHWGQEYRARPHATQTELAHWLIDHGIDAVIGGHPHWMESVEVYRGHPIAYSLGNFVFDQDFSDETRSGLAVRLDISPTAYTLNLHPVKIDASQPRFLDGADRDARLEYLAKISDPSLVDQIRVGVIQIPRE